MANWFGYPSSSTNYRNAWQGSQWHMQCSKYFIQVFALLPVHLYHSNITFKILQNAISTTHIVINHHWLSCQMQCHNRLNCDFSDNNLTENLSLVI